MASSSSATDFTGRWKYDVFVSFCHEDILKGFMSHLFSDFKRKGIHCFRDYDPPIDGKDEISSKIYEAIEMSRFLVVIFSKNYASSTRCLNELLRMIELKEMDDCYEIRTVFYDVKPYMVRYQTDSYKTAFEKHEALNRKGGPDWRKPLIESAAFSGLDLEFKPNGFESALIDIISKNIFEILCHGPLDIAENLVGLHWWAEKMKLNRFIRSSEAHMIGICGIGGVGKTTVARAIYNKLYIHFDGCSFCEDVSGVEELDGLPHIQKQLIENITMRGDLKIRSVSRGITEIKNRLRSKRVLIFLDDVDHRRQLEALAGRHSWFCPGSLVIVTSRDRQLLNAHGVNEIYEVDCLKNEEAMELFCLHAFKAKHPKEKFEKLADDVVQYAKGHPYSLEELGRFLFNKEICEWECELKKLQRFPNAEIQKVLKKSFNDLDAMQRKIFLDIACFFRGEDIDFVTRIVDGCDLFSDTVIRALVDKLLITISDDKKLQMLDLIQQMAKEIVREESKDPALRSRLWFPEDVCYVLNKDKGTESIQGIVLDVSSSKVQISSGTFAKMNLLRLLKLYYGCLDVSGVQTEQNHLLMEDSKLGCSGALEYLSNELRLLCWHGYPFEFLPQTFFPGNLVFLDMSYSNIKELWTGGTKHFLNRLTHMKLNHCHNLTKTPDFTQIPNLVELVLEGCTSLVEVHTSVGVLKSLTFLSLKNCKNIRKLPSIFELDSLQILVLSGCSKLDKIHEDLFKIKTLVELLADGTALYQLPSSTVSLSNLKVLSLGRCAGIPPRFQSSYWPFTLLGITQHPMALVVPSLSGLILLKTLDVSHCYLSSPSLNDILYLSLLEELNLSGTDLAVLPKSFSQLPQLKKLGLVGCRKLQILPELPSSIALVDAMDCVSLEVSTKPQIMYKSNNLFFVFANCAKLLEVRTFEGFFNMLLPQGCFGPYGILSMFFPGSEIPKLFNYNQNKGNCVRVELLPHWSSSKLKGFAIASVITPKNLDSYKMQEIGILCHMRSYGCQSSTAFDIKTKLFPNEIRSIRSDQIWLSICTSTDVFSQTKEFIEVSLETYGIDAEVKQCGVSFLYDTDVGEISPGMVQGRAPDVEDASILQPIPDEVAVIEEKP